MSVLDKLKSECEWAINQIDDGDVVSVPETRSFFSLVLQTLKRMDRLNNKLTSKGHEFILVIILDVVIWVVTGIVVCCTVKSTGNPYWSLLMLIPGFFQMSYNETEKHKLKERITNERIKDLS